MEAGCLGKSNPFRLGRIFHKTKNVSWVSTAEEPECQRKEQALGEPLSILSVGVA